MPTPQQIVHQQALLLRADLAAFEVASANGKWTQLRTILCNAVRAIDAIAISMECIDSMEADVIRDEVRGMKILTVPESPENSEGGEVALRPTKRVKLKGDTDG